MVGAGYDENKIGAHPDRDALDRAAGGRPVWLRHTSGHMCVVNTPLLAELGLADAARDVPGGLVVTDAAGRPTGLLQEQAQQLLNALVLPYPVATLVDAIERAGGSTSRRASPRWSRPAWAAAGSARARSRSRRTSPRASRAACPCGWS